MLIKAKITAGVPNDRLAKKLFPYKLPRIESDAKILKVPFDQKRLNMVFPKTEPGGTFVIIKGEVYEYSGEIDFKVVYPDDWPDETMRGKPRGLAAIFEEIKADDKQISRDEKVKDKAE